MEITQIKAHYDGDKIVLDEPFKLKPNVRLIVTVLPEDDLGEDWSLSARKNLARAYNDDEPEYGLDSIKELNPDYEGR